MRIAPLTDALRPLAANEESIISKLVLSRLVMALSRAAAHLLTRVYLPQEAVNTHKVLIERLT